MIIHRRAYRSREAVVIAPLMLRTEMLGRQVSRAKVNSRTNVKILAEIPVSLEPSPIWPGLGPAAFRCAPARRKRRSAFVAMASAGWLVRRQRAWHEGPSLSTTAPAERPGCHAGCAAACAIQPAAPGQPRRWQHGPRYPVPASPSKRPPDYAATVPCIWLCT